MAKPPMPNFASPKVVETVINGRTMRVYPRSALATLRLQSADGVSPELAGFVILDALHDEPWNVRPAPPELVQAFLLATDEAALEALSRAITEVNRVDSAGPPPGPATAPTATPSTT